MMGCFSLQLADLAVQLDRCALILHIFILSGTQSDRWLQATVASGKQIQQLLSYLPLEISTEVVAFLLELGSISIQEKKKKNSTEGFYCFVLLEKGVFHTNWRVGH